MKQQKKICAVVLAGGFGTRLSPLTDETPKPLVRILDTPVLSAILCNLSKTKIEKTVVSTCYHPEKIEKFCKENFPEVECRKECVPLGTAGGVKFCADKDCDAVLVVSGDAVFDFSLQKVIDFHAANEAEVTIVASRKENPTHYGVMETDENMNVTSFCEKPSWKKVKGNLVNTGIYVVSKSVLCTIPDYLQYDFSKNLFPRLLKEGRSIKVFDVDGFWCDIGSFDEYFECNRLAAKGKVSCIEDRGISAEDLGKRGVDAGNDVYVSQNAIIGKNVRLSDGAVLCENTCVADSCDISSCIVFENCRIGKGSSLYGSIIGEGCVVGENCIIPEGCVIGDKSRIADGTVLSRNERISARSTVGGREREKMFFGSKSNMFVDDGVCLVEKADVCSYVLRLSEAVNAAFAKGDNMFCQFAVMSDNNTLHLKNLFVSGLLQCGAVVFDCLEGTKNVCSYITAKLDADSGVYFAEENEKVTVSFFNREGDAVDEQDERKITKAFSLVKGSGEMSVSQHSIITIPATQMYSVLLQGFAQKLTGNRSFDGIKIFISPDAKTHSKALGVLETLLCRMSACLTKESSKDVLNVSVNKDGTRATLRFGNTILDHEHIVAAVLKNKEILGIEKMYVGTNAPSVLKQMAEKTQNKTFCPENLVFGDACFAIVSFLSAMVVRGENADALSREIPLFEIFRDEFIGDINRGETMQRLSRLYNDTKNDSGDGIRLSMADGNVTVIPDRTRGLKIVAEAQSMEAARELTIKIGDIIKGK